MPPPTRAPARPLARLAQLAPWGLASASLVVAGLSQLEARQHAAAAGRAQAACDGALDELTAGRIDDQRACREAQDALTDEHRGALAALRSAWEERERLREEHLRLELEKARLAGAESVLQAASAPGGKSNPLLTELRKLKAELEARQAALAQADRKLADAAAEIERLGAEKRKLARALDAAHTSVAEAELAREDATREVRRARESAVEVDWDRFVHGAVQELCWSGLKGRRSRCKEDLEATLLQHKVPWLLCRLEDDARAQIVRAPPSPPPTSTARLLLEDGAQSAWLVLCDHSLGDGLDAPEPPAAPPTDDPRDLMGPEPPPF
jgi:hypothetical protein